MGIGLGLGIGLACARVNSPPTVAITAEVLVLSHTESKRARKRGESGNGVRTGSRLEVFSCSRDSSCSRAWERFCPRRLAEFRAIVDPVSRSTHRTEPCITVCVIARPPRTEIEKANSRAKAFALLRCTASSAVTVTRQFLGVTLHVSLSAGKIG